MPKLSTKLKQLLTGQLTRLLLAYLLIFFVMLYVIYSMHQQRVIVQNINFPADFMGAYTLTAYCPCKKCVGPKLDIRTSTGVKPQINRTIAVDPSIIPYGSIVYIEELGYYIAEDCGGSIKGNTIDIFFATHDEAVKFGKQTRNVWIMKKENNYEQ